jgi:DNA repair and recombination protein RAD52
MRRQHHYRDDPLMPFSEAQVQVLSGKLNGGREDPARTRPDPIEGWHAIAEANRVFGFEGWDRETVVAESF